ncbi:glycoside hydrolase family 97 protein [Flavihumibacter sp. UBA7668]|uniref:glycoside hydrolase family 97 protein n=1 Tax=Flavihumibacter sp. UBA7668 TaxID=1946542 RepID=UPI0025C5B042|nr:glycoside hydrolase family 97 protein [Flavihumibacter sp. UBA7668]
MLYVRIIFLLISSSISVFGAAQDLVVTSPDAHLTAKVKLQNGELWYQVFKGNQEVLLPSRLGLRLQYQNFHTELRFVKPGESYPIRDSYTIRTGKKLNHEYHANRRSIWVKNAAGKQMELIVQVSDDGIAIRYHLPDAGNQAEDLIEELTGYHFPESSRSWLQPMSVAKTGWEQSNPSYEEEYAIDKPVGLPSKAGWVYPALFRSNGTWLLISEAAVDSLHCATRLINDSASSNYQTGTPDPREIFPGGKRYSQVKGNWYSPWRIIAIGDLSTITSSTLGTDLAPGSVLNKDSWVKGGQASWSWINSKDDSIVYSEQKNYVDYAARMGWEYCLIDVNWDTKIGYDSITQLATYASGKNVGLILWYNSAGSWNTTPYHPRDLILSSASRRAEFSRIQKMGIKGVKIDFFGGDGQSMIAYYHAILKDAADFQLLVNFHGATLPRGWQRTYPHLVTTEAVKGFEMVKFGQAFADVQAKHCTVLPFTRNVFDPMDFTPMNLYKIPTSVQRKTSSAFELALSVIFWSGIQHYAESPAGMDKTPEYVQDFLRNLPDSWEEMKWIDGYPGEYVVLARKSGKNWYIAGINGTDQTKTITLNLKDLTFQSGQLIRDGLNGDLFIMESVPIKKQALTITMKAQGGFVLALQ